MPLDVPDAHAAGVEGQDAVVEAGQPALPRADQLGLEAPLAVPGNVHRDLPLVGEQRLARVAVPAVAGPLRPSLTGVVPEVGGELGLKRFLHQPGRELPEKTPFAEQVVRVLYRLHQLVENLVLDRRSVEMSHGLVLLGS